MKTQRKPRSWIVANSARVAPLLSFKSMSMAFTYVRHVCNLMKQSGYILYRPKCRTKINRKLGVKEVWLFFADAITGKGQIVRLVENR